MQAEEFADTQTGIVHLSRMGIWAALGRKDSGLPGGYCGPAYASERQMAVTFASDGTAPGSSVTNESAAPFGGWGEPTVLLHTSDPDPAACFDLYNPAPFLQASADVLLVQPSFMWHWQPDQSGAPEQRAAINDGVMDVRTLFARVGAQGTVNAAPIPGKLSSLSYVGGRRSPLIRRGSGYKDPVSKIFNTTGSDRDAGFVFMTTAGTVAPWSPQCNASSSIGLFDRSCYPARWKVFYWGGQMSHAGGLAYSWQDFGYAFMGVLSGALRYEGYGSLSTETLGIYGGLGGDGHPFADSSMLPAVVHQATGNASTIVLQLGTKGACDRTNALRMHASVTGTTSSGNSSGNGTDSSKSPAQAYSSSTGAAPTVLRLRLNARTTTAGFVRVGISGSAGDAAPGRHEALPGFTLERSIPLRNDDTSHLVAWNQSI